MELEHEAVDMAATPCEHYPADAPNTSKNCGCNRQVFPDEASFLSSLQGSPPITGLSPGWCAPSP